MVSTGEPSVEDPFLSLLDQDRERATAKYHELFAKLVRYFEWRHCRPPHPEDLAQETLRRGFTKMASGAQIYAEHPGGYFFGIAQKVLLEHWKSERRVAVAVEDEAFVVQASAGAVDARIYVDQCLASLTPSERDLLRKYFVEDRKQLSEHLGLGAGGLRVRVHRILEKVRYYIRSIEARTK